MSVSQLPLLCKIALPPIKEVLDFPLAESLVATLTIECPPHPSAGHCDMGTVREAQAIENLD